MMERNEKKAEILESILPEQFEKSSVETALYCEKNSSEIVAEFLNALKEAAEPVVRKEKKEAYRIHYLLFSCLHSSIFLKKYLIRIDLMRESFYGDPPMATAYWDAGAIYRLFEEDIEQINQKVAKRLPRIREYEIDDMRYAYEPYYHRMAKKFICEMLEGIFEKKETEEKNLKILFGEYMGEADLLFVAERERAYEIFQNLCG